MISQEKFNALIPVQYQIVQEKGFLNDGFNEGHWLFMIVTEMAEAVNAQRKAKLSTHAVLKEVVFQIEYSDHDWKEIYEREIKNTFQDELADIYIRLLSYCGQKRINIDTKGIILPSRLMISKTIPESFMVMTGMLWKAYFHLDTDTEETWLSQFFACLTYITTGFGMDMEGHILAKMEYNKSMEVMNGKLY